MLVRNVLGNDPFLAGLNDEEQARRSWRDFEQGLDRLRNCTGTRVDNSSSGQSPSDMELLNKEAQDLQKRVKLGFLVKNPEMRDEAMQLVLRIEGATSQICGPATGMDEALTLIEKRHEGNNP
jgi:hypothetical protein